MNNCRVTFVRCETGETFEEEFFDPYIYRYSGGGKWVPGVSYAGQPIADKLRTVYNLHKPPPDG